MNSKFDFTIDNQSLSGVQFDILSQVKPTRFHSSHAIWQLARMGAYNTSGAIPSAIRIDSHGEISELYDDHERLVSFIDMLDNEQDERRLLLDILLGFSVRSAKSSSKIPVKFHIITCAKSMESEPSVLSEWKSISEIKDNLELKLSLVSIQDPTFQIDGNKELIRRIIESTSIDYIRRRHGRHGEEMLWGMELEAVKVLQDAGIAGPDVLAALKTLTRTVNPDPASASGPVVFDRPAAYLSIRDFQRRARIAMPCVRVIDERFLEEEKVTPGILPRIPSWNQVVSSNAIPLAYCENFESAMKWVRRAILSSGRGLLPAFFFTGSAGSGKSILLKQIAWALYQQGYAIAEILDIEEAAAEAERLASAAVSGNSPLILVWDDAHGRGSDPVTGIKEIAAAQITGVPILLLGCMPDASSVSKQCKKISRIIFEEFTVHGPAAKESTTEPDSDPDQQKQSAMTVIPSWVNTYLQMTFDELIDQTVQDLQSLAPEICDLYLHAAILGSLGLSLPASLYDKLSGPAAQSILSESVTRRKDPLFRTTLKNGTGQIVCVDSGHISYVQAMIEKMQVATERKIALFQNIIHHCLQGSDLHFFIVSILRSLNDSKEHTSELRENVSGLIRDAIDQDPGRFGAHILRDLFYILEEDSDQQLHQVLVDRMAERARSCSTESFIVLPPLLRNRLGGLTEAEIFECVRAAKPSFDRLGFRFLLKFLADHLPGEMGQQSIEEARTAAARDPDDGHAVAAYLRLVWQRGSEEQIERAAQETRSWLDTQPDDRLVRRAFYDYVSKKGDDELKTRAAEELLSWLVQHFDEGPLRRTLLDIAASLNDPGLIDKTLAQTADWMQKLGNNRSVRMQYFKMAEHRNDKEIMNRACEVALSWLASHPDDRDSIRSLMFISNRTNQSSYIDRAIPIITHFFKSHIIDKELLRFYMTLCDKTQKDELLVDAIEIADRHLDEHPEENDIRELLLGLAGKKIHSKIQNKIYDKAATWLEAQEKPHPMLEYLTGRLGVRAGVARRAIPLLERAAARDEETLKNHARLWLGSAYRIAGEFKLAQNEWKKVAETADESMKEKALKNIDALNSFLAKKFPEGYPPPEESRPRPKRRPERETVPGGQPPESRPSGRPRPVEQKPRISGPVRVPAGSAAPTAPAAVSGTPKPEQKPPSAPRPPQQPRQKWDDRKSKPRTEPRQEPLRQGATLGDLLKAKGLDLKEELSKSSKSQKK